MKKDIHPQYVPAKVTCVCGNEFVTRSAVGDVRLEICNECHPFFTGRQKIIDTAGRIDKFNQRFQKSKTIRAAKQQPAEAQPAESQEAGATE